MKTISVGKKAPSIALPDKDGNVFKLDDLKSDYSVVYFYPKDNTPGCTIEAKEFSKNLKKFSKLGASVVGISGGDEKSKTKFCKAQKLTVKLLSDSDFSVSKKFGVYGEKSFMGRKYMGIHRITFLLDKNKKVLKVYDDVTPEGHSEEVWSDIEALMGSKRRKKTTSKLTTRPKRKLRK